MTTDMIVYPWSCPHGLLLYLHRPIAEKLTTSVEGRWRRIIKTLDQRSKTSSGVNPFLRALLTLRRAAPSTDRAQSTDQGVCRQKEDNTQLGRLD
jgi:hypothetical protein